MVKPVSSERFEGPFGRSERPGLEISGVTVDTRAGFLVFWGRGDPLSTISL